MEFERTLRGQVLPLDRIANGAGLDPRAHADVRTWGSEGPIAMILLSQHSAK